MNYATAVMTLSSIWQENALISKLLKFSPFFPVRGSGPPAQSTRGPRTTDAAGPVLLLHSPLDGTEVGRVGEVHLPVQSCTELTDYHILSMWLVLSNA